MKMQETWADEVADKVLELKRKEYVCEGMYTPSGFFHIGNARSELFTPYAVHRALKDRGEKTKQVFVLDDFDAVRKIPNDVKLSEEEKEQFMGLPIYLAPSPIKGYDSWKEAFTDGLVEAIELFGLEPEIVSAYETYKEGKFNDLIRESLDKASQIVGVWNRVSGSEKAENFLPVQMLCDECGKSLFTKGTSWDGKEVEYECRCGYKGKKSPFDGNSKLHWRVHWAAHWILRDICYESAGKDHFSKGGSVDVGQAIMKEVFGKQAPYQTPTEFILVAGAKMSGSVGNVVNLQKWMTVSFERAERIYYGLEKAQNEKLTEKIKRNYRFSKLEEPRKEAPERIGYQFAAFLSQLFDPEKEFEKIEEIALSTGHISKKLEGANREEAVQKLIRAKHWAENFAPERHIVKFVEVPVKEGTNPETIKLLGVFAEKIPSIDSADELQSEFYNLAKANDVKPKEFFQAAYLVLLGKNYGPKIGTLILALGKERVIKRFKEL